MDSTDIWQEGLRLGPLKVAEGGEARADVVDLLGRNSRFSYPARGDLMAQIACARTGDRRLRAIVERFGLETVHAARDAIFDQTERVERAAVAAIPDGVYEAEGCIDDDGLGADAVSIRVRVTVEGERLEIDLTGTDDMQRGPVNCGRAQAVSACRVAYKTLIDSDRPPNGGAFRPLEVKVRPGSLLAAEEPAPCAWYFTTLGLLIDLVVKALAPVIPAQAAGASYGDSMVFGAAGIDPRSGGLFFHLEPTVGGWGAWDGSDGEGALINNVNGAMKDFPVEILETKVPLRVRRYGIRADSGGAGRWRGGNGVVREFELLCDEAVVYLWWERSRTPAWGLFGGHDGAPPEVVINPGREGEQRRFKSAGITLRRGDVVRGATGGGGGYGNPSERAREAIEEDLANGDLTAGAARALYGYEGGEA
jgi:N-methylhydantoinase B